MPLAPCVIAAALYQSSATAPVKAPAPDGYHLQFVGSYAANAFAQSATEIAAYHPGSKRLYVLNGTVGVDILDLSDPAKPTKVRTFRKASPNSIAVHGDLVAAAFAARTKDAPGEVVFLNTDGRQIGAVTVEFGPDMLVFTPDGSKILVANEGEPDDQGTVDPEGSISIIDLAAGPEKATVRHAGFHAFEAQRAELQKGGVHLPVPGHTLAQQFEPEYIALDATGARAFVTIQEANAVAIVDIAKCEVVGVVPLGLKDFSKCGLDASDKDGRADIEKWPVFGLRQPDTVQSWRADGVEYFAISEEGECRDTPGFSETERVAKLALDPKAFPLRESSEEGWSRTELVKPELLGRLEVSKPACDTDGDGDADRLLAFGGRGISIWRVNGNTAELAWDSGSAIEQTVADRMPKAFNANNDESPSRDTRSRTKGPEPEGMTVVELDGKRLLFVGLERAGGVMTWDVTNAAAPVLLDYANRRDPTVDLDADENKDQMPDSLAQAGDLGPEGLLFIPAASSPDQTPLLVVCNEVSGTTTVWRIVRGAAADPNPRRGL